MSLVSAGVLRVYLLATGWRDEGNDSSGLRVFSTAEPRLPTGRAVVVLAADDGNQVGDGDLEAVAFAEHRGIAEVVDDLLTGGADVIAARLLPPSMPSGQAPLSLVRRAVAGMHALLDGASFGVDDAAVVLPNRRPERQQHWLERVRVSTEPGSFILNVVCPLDDDAPGADDENTLFPFDDPQPYGRRVVDFLGDAVDRAIRIADEHVQAGKNSITSAADESTVTSDLPDISDVNVSILEGLAALGGTGEAAYDLRLSRSPRLGDSAEPIIISVQAETQQMLHQVAEVLKSPAVRSGVRITGAVVRLHRDSLFGAGDVTVAATLGDETTGAVRRVMMSLSEDDYREAIAAHGDGRTVEVVGDVVRSGTRFSLRTPRSFIAHEDLFADVLSNSDEDETS